MLHDLWFRVRSLLRRGKAENELDEELRFHCERQAQKYLAAGMARPEAERRARLEFGGLEQVKEECRDARGLPWLETLAHDTHYALRMLRKSPGFTAVAILTLALGIGANTAIFSVVDAVLLKALPYPHPEELISVDLSPLALDASLRGTAPEEYFIFREQSRTLQDIGVFKETDADRDVNVTGFREPERVHALQVSDGVLPILGIQPMLGRVFSAADDAAGSAPTVVLTYGYWQRKLSGDPAAIGKTMVIDGVAREIIGVMPRNFRFLDQTNVGLILPLQLDRNKIALGNFSHFGVARLKPGVSMEQVYADLARLIPIALDSFPATGGVSLELLKKSRLAPNLMPLKQDVIGNVGTLLWVLMGGIGMVLLIACANVANLLLVRTEGRRHELALRAALGASRRRIAVQLLRESAVLGLLGGIFGLGLTWAALRFLVRLAPAGLPRIDDVAIDGRVVGFTLAIAVLTSLLFGLIPVFKHSTTGGGLRESGRTTSPSRERHRAQNSLVALQVALALVLLVCSGLMIRTFLLLTRVNPGFVRPEQVQTFRVSISPNEEADEAKVPRLEQAIQERLAEIPGVSAVGFANSAPMDGSNYLDNVFAADRAYEHGAIPPLRHLVFMSPGYLQTIGTPLVAGRDLTWDDIYNKVPVALVSENLAREYWGSPAGALNKRVRVRDGDDWRQIVGVAGDVHDQGMDRPARTTVYWPIFMTMYSARPQRATRYVTFAVRSSKAGSESLMKQAEQAVWSVNGNLPLGKVYTLDHFLAESMARTSFTLVMLGIAGGMALVLGMVGLYGVIAYTVSQRTREIGVRMALGAEPRKILALVVGRGMGIIGAGLAAGFVSALMLTRLLSSMLFGVRPGDPLTYAVVVLLLGVVALVACYLPARRAMRVEPMVALRCE